MSLDVSCLRFTPLPFAVHSTAYYCTLLLLHQSLYYSPHCLPRTLTSRLVMYTASRSNTRQPAKSNMVNVRRKIIHTLHLHKSLYGPRRAVHSFSTLHLLQPPIPMQRYRPASSSNQCSNSSCQAAGNLSLVGDK